MPPHSLLTLPVLIDISVVWLSSGEGLRKPLPYKAKRAIFVSGQCGSKDGYGKLLTSLFNERNPSTQHSCCDLTHNEKFANYVIVWLLVMVIRQGYHE